ncbi:hypothetical protein N8376_05400 [Flavobacteriaceae bacterium]|nr:hypothetical protein [Flavobacteriaceae bacterium]MDC1492770.1 hypothetical protein [Flavobacteriaceae bacterium]
MKKLQTIITILLFAAVIYLWQDKPSANSTERSIGFTNWSDDGEVYKWSLGTDAAVNLVKDLDKVWTEENYTEMRSFFADTAKFYFRDGKYFNNTNDFINEISSQEDSPTNWEFIGAYSVDLDPLRGGEHVQASFEVTNKEDGTLIRELHEQYYVIDKKIVQWRQFSLPTK